MDPDLLDTQLLSTFVTIAESQSLTDAANRLSVTQSAISQSLKQLEGMVGAELIVRRTRPVQLTATGQVLKRSADTILADLRRLNVQLRSAAEMNLVQCRLGLVTSCSEVFGSRLIARLSSRIERLALRSGMTPTLMQAFLDREIDILVSSEPMHDVEGLERVQLCRDPMLAAIPTTMLEGVKTEVNHGGRGRLESLLQSEPLIRYGRNTHIGALSEVTMRRMRLQTNVRYETDDTHTLMSFVQDGHGWAILSGLCLAQVLYRTEGVRFIELDASRHARELYLLAREGEMGDIPSQVAESTRTLLRKDIVPDLAVHAPWLNEEHFAIGQYT
ncbi:LysR family transcriptional regulator [Marinobacter sp. 71-i]|uniref:LysR family transcriptional regulator n=1 Tax=Marinobacter iranensis TaxID=2962607 RepID=A0ABT5YB45_9GAMM|nr:LysR family transcriptional regulator [Marinobacter iranensis]MDF0750890.1 LysR family transcriptional regulator [Marinobacter iranensis]